MTPNNENFCLAHTGMQSDIKALREKLDMIETYLSEKIGKHDIELKETQDKQFKIIIGVVLLSVVVSLFAPSLTPFLLAAL